MPIEITSAEKRVLKDILIPPRPEVLIRITDENKKDEPDIGFIATEISEDVGLSSAVLQIVNSTAFRKAREIESIQQAVMTLGLKRLLVLVKSVALKSAMGDSDRLTKFWQYSSKIATVASLSCEYFNKSALQDQAYMMGLFHNAGIPVMLLKFDDYDQILKITDEKGWLGITKAERKTYRTSHPVIGALLGKKWNLSAAMIEVIYYQFHVEGIYDSGELSAEALDLLTILKFARYIVNVEQSGNPNNAEWAELEDCILQHYGLTEVDLENYREQVLEKLAEG